jgi:hypothetical protein
MRSLLPGLCLLLLSSAHFSVAQDYKFDGKISEEVLRNYLARSMTMMESLTDGQDFADNLRMFASCGGKFYGRGLYVWGHESRLLGKLAEAKEKIARLHAADPDIVVEACIFEIVSKEVNRIAIPAWVFEGLGMPVEKRNFRYADIIYPDGKGRKWGSDSEVPDVSRPETKLWFYFLAATYIDAGCESIHYGQTEIMDDNDPHLDHWSEVLSLARSYAAKKARRHMVLCNAHVPGGGLVKDGRLLLDFHAFPLRIEEVKETPRKGILELGYKDSLFGRSKGGITPSGWKCEHLPYLVEFDNYGRSESPGEPGMGVFWVWGWDEITWFSQQGKDERDAWLRYAWNWVRENDPNGYLEMPGYRMISGAPDGKRIYRANNPGDASPEGCGQEDTIREIWKTAPAKSKSDS